MKAVPNPRCGRETKHDHGEVLVCLVAGFLAGKTTIRRSLRWCKKHLEELREYLPLKNGIASLSTACRLLAGMDEERDAQGNDITPDIKTFLKKGSRRKPKPAQDEEAGKDILKTGMISDMELTTEEIGRTAHIKIYILPGWKCKNHDGWEWRNRGIYLCKAGIYTINMMGETAYYQNYRESRKPVIGMIYVEMVWKNVKKRGRMKVLEYNDSNHNSFYLIPVFHSDYSGIGNKEKTRIAIDLLKTIEKDKIAILEYEQLMQVLDDTLSIRNTVIIYLEKLNVKLY